MKSRLSKKFGNNYICEIGKISGGQVRNAIPNKVLFEGTMRSFTIDNQIKMKKILQEISSEIEERTDVKISIDFLSDYIHVNNNNNLFVNLKNNLLHTKYKFIEATSVMTGEDFGFFTKKFPGLLFWLGADNGNHYDLHYSKFLPDENAIEVGIDVFYKMIEL